MTGDVVRLRLPVVFCGQCRSQVLTADAWGRWTSPTFRVAAAMPEDVTALRCVHCASRASDPEELQALVPAHAHWVPGSAPALSEVECFDLLLSIGAEQTDVTAPGPRGGAWW